MRIGIGYDIHKLAENRDLILGGVKIPFELGLLGHSDADVLVHAIIDANKNLTESNERNDWEMMGSDINELQQLINSLEKMLEEQQ